MRASTACAQAGRQAGGTYHRGERQLAEEVEGDGEALWDGLRVAGADAEGEVGDRDRRRGDGDADIGPLRGAVHEQVLRARRARHRRHPQKPTKKGRASAQEGERARRRAE